MPVSVNSDLAESLRREKARNLRYKKAIHADLNLASIGSKLMEMYESASDVLYWCENDGESTQLDELIGDEEETYELRMAFSTLEGDCQQMLDDLDNEWVPEFFDDFFGGISPRGSMMLGFDSYEGDYFGLDDRYERDLAQKECVKRLMAHTKAEIIEAYAICFRVAINYMALSSRYDGLKSYIDILNGTNTGFLAAVKRIEDLYEKITADFPRWEDREEFDRLCNSMPPEVWLL